MKAELVSKEPEPFKPITISITIESKAELDQLWHRFNLGPKSISQVATHVQGISIGTEHLSHPVMSLISNLYPKVVPKETVRSRIGEIIEVLDRDPRAMGSFGLGRMF